MREIRKCVFALVACVLFIWVLAWVLGVSAGMLQQVMLLDPWLFAIFGGAVFMWSLAIAAVEAFAILIMVFIIMDLTTAVFLHIGWVSAANTADARMRWLQDQL